MTIDHLTFVTLNFYKIDTAIDKYYPNFIVFINGLENTFNTN